MAETIDIIFTAILWGVPVGTFFVGVVCAVIHDEFGKGESDE